MRIRSVHIENFRGIEFFEVTDLHDLVVIAGPNGCGKTCVLDGIRLLKSVYGGYFANEWQTWFGEFQINVADAEGMLHLFRDRTIPLRISADLELSDEERSYIDIHAEDILRPIIWQSVVGRNVESGLSISADEISRYSQSVTTRIQAEAAQLRNGIQTNIHKAGLTISPTPQIAVEPEPVLQVIFQTYSPRKLGVIDYHSSSRVYEREMLGQVNLNLENVTQQRRAHSLYNSREKYRNVKTELAANYVLGVIASKATQSEIPDVNSTLSELFRIFFPGKQYLGPVPQPNGKAGFPGPIAVRRSARYR